MQKDYDQAETMYHIRDSEELILKEKKHTMRTYISPIVPLLQEPWEATMPGQLVYVYLPPDLIRRIIDFLRDEPRHKHVVVGAAYSLITSHFPTSTVEIYYEIAKKRHDLLSLVGLGNPSFSREINPIKDLVDAPKKMRHNNIRYFCRLQKPLNE